MKMREKSISYKKERAALLRVSVIRSLKCLFLIKCMREIILEVIDNQISRSMDCLVMKIQEYLQVKNTTI